MIIGLTHREDLTPIQRLAVAYKVSIGIPATDGKNYPQKSDHFHIRAKNKDGEWVDDKPFTEQLQSLYMPEVQVDGKKGYLPLREFDIIFLSDNIDEVFKTELAWWAASEKKCSGNGQTAMRSISALPPAEAAKHKNEQSIEWAPCGDACPDLDQGRCKPSGQLSFIFKDRPIMGSVASYTTTSYESIVRIHSSLLQIQSITGGRLRGIPLKIVMRPGKTRYTDPQGKKKSGSAFFVNIEFRQSDFSQLVPKLLEHSTAYASQITAVRQLAEHSEDDTPPIDVETEQEQGKAMTSEFYPANIENVQTRPFAQSAEEIEIDYICGQLGLNAAHREMLNAALKGDISEISRWIKAFQEWCKRDNFTPQQIQNFYTSAIVKPWPMPPVPAANEAGPKKNARKKPEPAAPDAPPPVTPPPAAAQAATPEPTPEPAKEEPAENAVWNF